MAARAVAVGVAVLVCAWSVRAQQQQQQQPFDTTQASALQNEVLELQSLVAFFSCDCGDGVVAATGASTWCHCANPFILPKKFAPAPTESYDEQWSGYSPQYTCTNSTATGDSLCQLVTSFEAIEHSFVADDGTSVTEQEFVLSKTGADGGVWVQTNSNGTLSALDDCLLYTSPSPRDRG